MLICLFTARWIIHGEFQYRLRQATAARDVAVCNRDATTAEKLSETKFWVPTQAFRARPKAGLGVGCGRGSPPSRCEGPGVWPTENYRKLRC